VFFVSFFHPVNIYFLSTRVRVSAPMRTMWRGGMHSGPRMIQRATRRWGRKIEPGPVPGCKPLMRVGPGRRTLFIWTTAGFSSLVASDGDDHRHTSHLSDSCSGGTRSQRERKAASLRRYPTQGHRGFQSEGSGPLLISASPLWCIHRLFDWNPGEKLEEIFNLLK